MVKVVASLIRNFRCNIICLQSLNHCLFTTLAVRCHSVMCWVAWIVTYNDICSWTSQSKNCLKSANYVHTCVYQQTMLQDIRTYISHKELFCCNLTLSHFFLFQSHSELNPVGVSSDDSYFSHSVSLEAECLMWYII